MSLFWCNLLLYGKLQWWGDITPGDTDSQTDSDEEQEDLFAGSGTYIEGQYIDPEGPLGREDDIEGGEEAYGEHDEEWLEINDSVTAGASGELGLQGTSDSIAYLEESFSRKVQLVEGGGQFNSISLQQGLRSQRQQHRVL
jgi:hypothetical protein